MWPAWITLKLPEMNPIRRFSPTCSRICTGDSIGSLAVLTERNWAMESPEYVTLGYDARRCGSSKKYISRMKNSRTISEVYWNYPALQILPVAA